MKIVATALCLMLAFAPRAWAAPVPTQLSATPTTEQVATQRVGQTPVPLSFTYQIKTNRNWTNWRIGTLPTWLRTNALSGRTPFTLVLTIQSELPVGVYTATIPIIGGNTVQLNVRLTVTMVDPPPSPTSGACLDNVGGKLLDNVGGILICQERVL